MLNSLVSGRHGGAVLDGAKLREGCPAAAVNLAAAFCEEFTSARVAPQAWGSAIAHIGIAAPLGAEAAFRAVAGN
ncbi:MAG: hypothetical protein ACOVLH_03550, partial [Roseateles sp.]